MHNKVEVVTVNFELDNLVAPLAECKQVALQALVARPVLDSLIVVSGSLFSRYSPLYFSYFQKNPCLKFVNFIMVQG